jgi:enterochelin esterase family protein
LIWTKEFDVTSRDLLSRAQAQGTPLIDGETVTFVWQGKKTPRLIGDFTDWEGGQPAKMEKAGPSLWTYQTSFPRNAYLEYIFLDGEERYFDPFNPRRITNGVGKFNNYFSMPEYQPTPLVRYSRVIPHGRVTTHVLETQGTAAGKERTVYLYAPPVETPVPLVVVWDGRDYYRRAKLHRVVDNLIAQKRIQPLALAMVDNGKEARFLEYSCNDATLAFLMLQVLPLAHTQLNLLGLEAAQGAYGMLGASMGGLIAMYTAARLPHIFGKVFSQSGAFSMGDHPAVIFDLLHSAPRLPLKLWLDVGKYDFSGLITANEQMFALLREKGYPFETRVYPAGHNYTAWRDDLWRGLEYLFGKQTVTASAAVSS